MFLRRSERNTQMIGPRNFIAIRVKRNCETEILSAEIHQRAVMIAKLEFKFTQLIQWGEKGAHAFRCVLRFVSVHVFQCGHNLGRLGAKRDFGKRRVHYAVVIIVPNVVRVRGIRLHFVLVIVLVNFQIHVGIPVQTGRIRRHEHVARPPQWNREPLVSNGGGGGVGVIHALTVCHGARGCLVCINHIVWIAALTRQTLDESEVVSQTPIRVLIPANGGARLLRGG